MGKNKKGKKKRSKNVEGIVSDDHVASASVSNEEKKASLEDVSANENSTYDQSSKSSKKRKRVKEIPDPEGHDAKETIIASAALDFPFPTEPDDHCESPREAYTHILPLLSKLAGKDASKLRIYDPYFCDGAVKQNLGELGFPNVHNQKEDCYEVWSNPKDYPTHDLVVTNPPYSGDHMAKLFEHVTSKQFGNRPWFLLLPNFVHKHEYYARSTSNIRPFYLVPRKRYVYVPPKDFREAKKSATHKKSSPFVSMWYIWGGDDTRNEELIRHFTRSSSGSDSTCDLARSKSALRDMRRKKR